MHPQPNSPAPVAMEPVPGTPFGVYVVGVAPTRSGFAFASLVTGLASMLVSTVVACFGLAGASAGWGPRVAGAFAVLALIAGGASLVLGRLGLRQTARVVGWAHVSGRGVAIWGLVCGGLGLVATLAALGLSFALVGVDLSGATAD